MIKEFKISTEIYSDNVVKSAIADFEEVSSIVFENNNIKITWDSDNEIDEIFNELMNYIVWLINE